MVPDFGKKLDVGDIEAIEAMISADRDKAKILAEIIMNMRKHYFLN